MTEPHLKPAFYDALREQIKRVDPDRADRAYWKLASDFEDSLLLQEELPSSAFDFIVYLLTSPEVTNRRGLTHFIMAIGSDFDKLKATQRNSLLDLLIEHHREYADELARQSIGGLIARYYPPAIALTALEALDGAGTQQGKHIAFVIADVLARRLAEADPLRNTVLGFLKTAR